LTGAPGQGLGGELLRYVLTRLAEDTPARALLWKSSQRIADPLTMLPVDPVLRTPRRADHYETDIT
jgi:hypothetical protein